MTDTDPKRRTRESPGPGPGRPASTRAADPPRPSGEDDVRRFVSAIRPREVHGVADRPDRSGRSGLSDRPVAPGWPPVEIYPSRAAARLEIGLAATGGALVAFMMMHLGLLLTSVFGASTMDTLATFLEEYYLLHIGAPIIVVLLVAHIVFAIRKLPATARQQAVFVRQVKSLRHLDTITWAVQIVTGAAILALIAIHLWVVLTDLPIQAAKSGARVAGGYLWFYIPLLVLAEAHASAGLYRIAVKWDLVRRPRAHRALLVWTVAFLGLGALVLAALFTLGGGA